MATRTVTMVFLATFVVSTRSAGLDTTLIDGARGEDVVNAVVNRIRSRCLFPEDRLFLRRSAYVVSKSGEDPSTYRPGYNGGIWQIGDAMFQATKNCSSIYIASHCRNILLEFGITWSSVTWSDLRKPLYSGLAATLYTLLQLLGQPMPGSIREQAQIWATIYNLPIDNFLSAPPTATKMGCSDKMDLIFILDSSGSVSYSDFALNRAFAANVVDVMNVTPSAVRVADIVFASTVFVEFDFQNYTNKADIRAHLNATRKLDSGTATSLALDAAASLLYDAKRGARQGVKKVAVLITDGQSNSLQKTNVSATYLKSKGSTVIVIGIGKYNLQELQSVASKPICANIFALQTFSVIGAILTEIQKMSCEAKVCVHLDTVVQDDIADSPTETTTQTTSGGNTTDIETEVTCGILDIYMSYNDTNSGPAIYDEKYMATDDSPAILSTSETLPEGSDVYITVVDMTVFCEESGIKRQCTAKDLNRVGLCKGGSDINYKFDNPCTPSSLANGVMRHPYPYDSTKFLQCDLLGNVYVTACPNGVAFNTKSLNCGFTSPSNTGVSGQTQGFSNPCTRTALANNQFYFTYGLDTTKFIQCDAWGNAFLMTCAPGTEWSQSAYTCAHQVVQKTAGKCSRAEQYLSDPCDHHAFLVCDAALHPQRMTCGSNLFFNPNHSTCDFTDVQPAGGC